MVGKGLRAPKAPKAPKALKALKALRALKALKALRVLRALRVLWPFQPAKLGFLRVLLFPARKAAIEQAIKTPRIIASSIANFPPFS